MRYSETCREDFPIKSSFLPDPPARCFHRTFGASAHIFGFEFFGGDQLTALNQSRSLLVNEVFAFQYCICKQYKIKLKIARLTRLLAYGLAGGMRGHKFTALDSKPYGPEAFKTTERGQNDG